jgi:hypothetical protein
MELYRKASEYQDGRRGSRFLDLFSGLWFFPKQRSRRTEEEGGVRKGRRNILY